jgi:tetratricopeptide (TPR) repeat protein
LKRTVIRIFSVVQIALVVAGLSCANRSDPIADKQDEGGVDLIKKGIQAEKAGKRTEALDAYTRAIQASDLTDEQLTFAYFRRGGVKGALGDNISGIEDFSKCIVLDPKFGPAYSLRGYLRGVVGEDDLAEKDHLVAINGKDDRVEDYLPWVLQNYADLWRRRGQFDKALAICDKALQAGKYPVAYFRRAWIYLDMGRIAQAKSEFEVFEAEMKRQNHSYEVFWPDERDAISKLRELR